MKRIWFLTFCLLVIAATAMAAGYLGKDRNNVPVAEFQPSSFGVYSSHKGVMTIDTTYVGAVQYKTSAVCNVTINGSGAAWPTAANAVEELRIAPRVTSLVFNCGSTAATAHSKVYFRTQ